MPTKFQFLMRFTKKGKAKNLSHRELLTFIEQAIRRADIPITFSEGFNPRLGLSFSTALSLGISSDDEIMSFQLSQWLSPNEILQKLSKVLINGITVSSIEPVRQNISGPFCVEYKITPINDNAVREIIHLTDDKIKNWLSQPSQIVQRDYINKNSKKVNLKDYVQKIELKDGCVLLTIKITNEGTARPDEVLLSLGIKENLKNGSFSIHKLKTFI